MKLLLIPLVCLILGVGGGVGAGIFLLPDPEPEPEPAIASTDESTDSVEEPAVESPAAVSLEVSGVEYIDLTNQFIVPLLIDGKVSAIVVLAIGLEVAEGTMQEVMLGEPKLRAAFLQTLFNHANNGGFDGNFTAFSTMQTLRRELLLVAQSISGSRVSDVLILDVVRQVP
ncbi:flagellar basal body-associated protein FliL [Rhodobacteraceae bacterium S2214]|nr:flagellar basal body-associated protein FliL [Rhodobacteraceae bacterium S2214]